MKVLHYFTKKDGSRTPTMTTEEFLNKKYLDYGITEEHVEEISFNFIKALIEGCYPEAKVERV